MAIAFGLLGPLTVHDGREPRPITSPTHRALLTHLLLDPNRPVTAEALVAAVWGERPPRTAQASLHNHIGRLRRSLGPLLEDRLRSTASGYVLRVEDGELDSAVFTTHLRTARSAHGERDWPRVAEQVTAALALWRGGPPAGSETGLDHLVELHLEALEWRFDAELELGRHHGLSAELARLTADHPLRESFHRQLMLVLHRTGRRADALAVYQELRTTLVEELGVEPGAAVQRAHQEVLAADGPLPQEEPDDAVAAVPVPAQLPTAPGDFTGRQGELDALALYLRPGDRDAPARVVLVTGMGGVGKTTLVVHGARAVREDYPDGQLYADLHGFGLSAARTPHDLLGRFLTDLGVAGETLPEHVDDRAALYRSLLAERRVLVVLDNAGDSRQVAPLLPGTGRSAVVVTSRHKLPGVQCSTRIPLGPLAEEEQRRLLAAMCGEDRVAADPVAAGKIMAACAGLPLALRIAGSRLAHRPSWRLDELARRLGRADRLKALAVDHLAVREAFSFSYSSLLAGDRPVEREAARAFRLLGLWPHHHSAESAAALMGAPVDDALDVLDALIDSHLLDQAASGRYRFHDLLGEFAAERAREDESEEARRSAQLRLVCWYAAAVTKANRTIAPQARPIPPLAGAGAAADPADPELPEFADEVAALEWCVDELPAIRSAVRLAVALDRPDVAWRAAAALFGYGLTYWWNGVWLECLEEALAATRAAGDREGQAWLHGRLGVANGLVQRNERSLDHLRTALELFRAVDDTEGQRVVLSNLAAASQQAGELDQAQAYLEQALELSTSTSRPGDLLTAGGVLFESGDLEGAERTFQAAVAGWRAAGSREKLSTALSNLGDTLRGLGRPQEALDVLAEALEIRRAQHSHGNVADTLETIARTHLEHGDPEVARRYFLETLELAQQHGLDHYRRLSLKGLEAFATRQAD
ncbi:BTAD domain-containing putative transcriptional regulator [Kitasatospora paracochleata]|uniref:DNA-binding SARP family transcriptional activator/tetratricopeptide (TPR) repeat protein n=1 Tax=Kitasatospora paracochleata TaxID=58354 RepID=A0ABT1IUQ8_9ACTN|nr:BTAD domain-containing putative transcriptional regulator [Kitasatospora paracochleata]MCP2308668.1 DNA-binding SARP family transcriptional activator/tetratricopeptide (TPR) repeat protein [Kitasatospora paracochleata]